MDYSKQIESIDQAIANLQATREKLIALKNKTSETKNTVKKKTCKYRGELIKKSSVCSSVAGWVECKNPKNVADRVTICICNEKCQYFED